MAMPHATDAFPHLEGLVPVRAASAGRADRRSQRRRAVATPS
jgi:hypothetical protein